MIVLGIIGLPEVLGIFFLILLFAGGKYLPGFMKNAGKSIRKKSLSNNKKMDNTIRDIIADQTMSENKP